MLARAGKRSAVFGGVRRCSAVFGGMAAVWQLSWSLLVAKRIST